MTTDIAPALIDIAPALADVAPALVDIAPALTDVAPALVDVAPAPDFSGYLENLSLNLSPKRLRCTHKSEIAD